MDLAENWMRDLTAVRDPTAIGCFMISDNASEGGFNKVTANSQATCCFIHHEASGEEKR